MRRSVEARIDEDDVPVRAARARTVLDTTGGAQVGGSQTLMRGLDVLEAVAARQMPLTQLAEGLGLNRSTAHRLASALVERGFLAFSPRIGYRLGAKMLELGSKALEQTDLVQIARSHLERLAEATQDTVHLGVLDADQALYLDKVPGRRRINISSRIGERQPLTSTGLGKALMLGKPQTYWTERLAAERRPPTFGEVEAWLDRMRGYRSAGYGFDLEENEDQIRCVAAPVRDASGGIAGAISVSSAAQYMSDERMAALATEVRETANAIGRELGWTGERDERVHE